MTGDAEASSRSARLADGLLFVWIVAFLGAAAVVALAYPFGHGFDEIEHWSMIVALSRAPTLFPTYGDYRILDADLVHWSAIPNYLAHPPLYYLLMAPLAVLFPDEPRVVRFADLLLVATGLLVALRAGRSRFVAAGDRFLFGVLLFGLSTTCGVAGLVNNDGLLILEFGLLFALVVAERDRPIALALLIAAIGWTKFNGFVFAVLLLALARLAEMARTRRLALGRGDLAVFLGGALGAVPTLVTWLRHGRLVWAPAAFPDWFEHVDPTVAAAFGRFDFAAWFFHAVAIKFAARPALLDLSLAVALLIVLPALLALAPQRGRRAAAEVGRVTTRPAVVALLLYAVLHVVYAWGSMRSTGSMVEAQIRYYVAPWFFVAAAVPVGLSRLPATVARLGRIAVVLLVITASIPASIALGLVVAPSPPTLPSPPAR